ncbi:hypothetical protein [Bradyrhizobium sp. LA2.1]|uniref:hypothetical protein n=1 Tax=Bradyrhizobium sp. LA2.1 TaxID=3156376 RepID=UPI003392329D
MHGNPATIIVDKGASYVEPEMNFSDWIAAAKAVEADIAKDFVLQRGPMMTALVRLHLLACEAPLVILDAYRRLVERTLRIATSRRIDRLFAGHLRWTPTTQNPDDWILALAVQIRAIDELLYNSVQTDFGDPAEDLSDWRCPETGMFVVPRERRLEDAQLEGRRYLKRGMLRHRIIPPEVGGFEVRLLRIDLRERGEKSGAAASLFANLRLSTRETRANNFIAHAVSFDDAENTLVEQITQSVDSGCAGVVWPELTVDESTRRQIADLLRERTVLGEDEFPLHWLVAGSWHEPEDAIFRNRATVLDGYGRTLHRYDKIIPAQDRSGRFEDIRPGDHIPILVTDTTLVALAVCRDFCDRATIQSPYLGLPVDLFVVPSIGGASTMAAHLNVAAEVKAKTGALTFVVQQTDFREAANSEFGFVLPMPEAPAEMSLKSLESKEIWSLHQD